MLSLRKLGFLGLTVLCGSDQAVSTSGPPPQAQSHPFPGRFKPQLETEARGQEPSLRRAQPAAQPLSQLLRPGMSPPAQRGDIPIPISETR